MVTIFSISLISIIVLMYLLQRVNKTLDSWMDILHEQPKLAYYLPSEFKEILLLILKFKPTNKQYWLEYCVRQKSREKLKELRKIPINEK